MEIAVFNSKSKEEISKLIAIANEMGISSKIIPSDEVEDFYFAFAMKKDETGEYVPEDEIFRELNK